MNLRNLWQMNQNKIWKKKKTKYINFRLRNAY